MVECSILENCSKNVLFSILLLFVRQACSDEAGPTQASDSHQDCIQSQGRIRPNTGVLAT